MVAVSRFVLTPLNHMNVPVQLDIQMKLAHVKVAINQFLKHNSQCSMIW